MRIVVSVLVISTLTLAGCGGLRDSRVNPMNWFGQSKSEVVVENTTPRRAGDRQTGNPLIENAAADSEQSGLFSLFRDDGVYEGTLIDEVTALRVERVPTGAIVHVTGLPQREGAFDVRVLAVNPDGPVNGVMEYTLNAMQPVDSPLGTVTTRAVEAGIFISQSDLAEIREIRVLGERNRQITTRP